MSSVIEEVTFVLYASDAKTNAEESSTRYGDKRQYTEKPRKYVQVPGQVQAYGPNGKLWRLPYIPIEQVHQRTGGLYSENPASGVFTDQNQERFLQSIFAPDGYYYIQGTDLRFYRVSDKTVYTEGPGTGFQPYIEPETFTNIGTAGSPTFVPDPNGKWVVGLDGEWTDNKSDLHPTTVLLYIRHTGDFHQEVIQGLLYENFIYSRKPNELRHHELTCRSEPAHPKVFHVQENTFKWIGFMGLFFEVPKSPDFLRAKVWGDRSGQKFWASFLYEPHNTVEGMTKSESLYPEEWKWQTHAELGDPGELLTFEFTYQRNRPYIVNAWYSFPAVTGGEIINRRQHPDPFWRNDTIYLYDISCEGVTLSNVLAMDLTEYQVGDWVNILKVTPSMAKIDPVENALVSVEEYRGKFDGNTPYQDIYVTEFVYRIMDVRSV